MQDLAARNSWLFTDDENNAVPIKSFIQMTKVLRLSGDDVHELMDSLMDYGENGSALFLLLNNMPPEGGRPRSLEPWKQSLREHLDDAGAPPAHRAAFQRTLDFLERG